MFCWIFYRVPESTVTYTSLKRSVQRARVFSLPKNVIDAESVRGAFSTPKTMEKFGLTNSNRTFYKDAVTVSGVHGFQYVVFASDEIIAQFQSAIPVNKRAFFMDATFKVCPFGVFNQLLIIYVSYMDRVCL